MSIKYCFFLLKFITVIHIWLWRKAILSVQPLTDHLEKQFIKQETVFVYIIILHIPEKVAVIVSDVFWIIKNFFKKKSDVFFLFITNIFLKFSHILIFWMCEIFTWLLPLSLNMMVLMAVQHLKCYLLVFFYISKGLGSLMNLKSRAIWQDNDLG